MFQYYNNNSFESWNTLSHRKSETVPKYLEGWQKQIRAGSWSPHNSGGPRWFLLPGVGQSLRYQLFVFVLLEQGLASSLG